MFRTKKSTKPQPLETLSDRSTVLSMTDRRGGLDFLVTFFSAIRPRRGHRNATANLEAATTALQERPLLLANLQQAALSQLAGTDLTWALTESGIPRARGFWQELFNRLRHKVLPPLQPDNDFLYVVNRVFFRNDDYLWVEEIPRAGWVAFFGVLSLHGDDQHILQQLLHSLNTLSFQVAQLGLEKEVLLYLPAECREKNPFVGQTYLVHELERRLSAGEEPAPLPANIGERIAHCNECIQHIRENHSRRGASLHQTYMLLLLANRLERMELLIDLLSVEHRVDDTGRFVNYFWLLIRNENRKNSIFEFMSQSLGYLAYQIAEHKGVKGGKYITSTWPEYRAMLRSAMGGGAWVCLMVLVKNLLTRLPMAVFWHGFMYSVNYSLGFILIEETHTTLATKQPAFTASAVASSLDTHGNTRQPNLYNLAVTVAKVSRSQIASFIGNLVIVFPGSWLLAWGYDAVFGSKLVSGDAAMHMLKDQHPWQSLSLLFACNAGVFLFLSGIIAGYVENKMRYGHIRERLQTHPILRLSMPAARLRSLAAYVEGHAGALIGNTCLGFFLGMAGFFGEIFGIDFEIRHITISAGNTALAVYGLGFRNIDPWYLAAVLGGVLGIGFFNFLVSFSLAFFVAARSRGVRLREYPEFLGILWRYFRSSPLDFIRPRARVLEE
jgi:site-specific recombinase